LVLDGEDVYGPIINTHMPFLGSKRVETEHGLKFSLMCLGQIILGLVIEALLIY